MNTGEFEKLAHKNGKKLMKNQRARYGLLI